VCEVLNRSRRAHPVDGAAAAMLAAGVDDPALKLLLAR
jgi:hypothetical protein